LEPGDQSACIDRYIASNTRIANRESIMPVDAFSVILRFNPAQTDVVFDCAVYELQYAEDDAKGCWRKVDRRLSILLKERRETNADADEAMTERLVQLNRSWEGARKPTSRPTRIEAIYSSETVDAEWVVDITLPLLHTSSINLLVSIESLVLIVCVNRF
jgi:hypothetical protein